MGTPATGTALILIVAFVLPGFVTVLFQERTFKSSQDPTPFDRLLRTVYYSVWCYLLLAVISLVCGVDRDFVERLYRDHQDTPADLVWRGALAVFGSAGTVALATLAWHESGANGAVLERLGFNERHQRPTAWDYWFGQRFESRLRISFADGTTVWGYYGRDSFASYAKDGRDLYLEGVYRERIVLEDEADDEAGGPWFGRSHPNSCGAWVNLSDAVRIEFYDLDDGGTTEETSTKQTDRARAKDRRPAATQEQGSSKETPATSAPAEEV